MARISTFAKKAFHCKLKKFFSDYHFSLWDLNKSLASFKEKDYQAFVRNATTLADWIEKTTLLMTKGDHEWEGVIGGLWTYKKIHDFMAKTIIKDEEVVQYKKKTRLNSRTM